MRFDNYNWWDYLDDDLKELVSQSGHLLEHLDNSTAQYKDFGYIVFPMAKAYEGFLKKLLYDMGLISKQQYYGEHFRLGRSLNPTLPKRYRSDWVYEKLEAYCKGSQLPMKMWEAWKQGRNRVFHYFPHEREFLSFNHAREIVEMLARTMEEAMAGCRVKY